MGGLIFGRSFGTNSCLSSLFCNVSCRLVFFLSGFQLCIQFVMVFFIFRDIKSPDEGRNKASKSACK